MNNDYTPEELAALPQTDAVFDLPPLQGNEHDWQQQGYMLSDACNPSKPTCVNVGIPIKSGSLLIKDRRGYHLVDELTRK